MGPGFLSIVFPGIKQNYAMRMHFTHATAHKGVTFGIMLCRCMNARGMCILQHMHASINAQARTGFFVFALPWYALLPQCNKPPLPSEMKESFQVVAS